MYILLFYSIISLSLNNKTALSVFMTSSDSRTNRRFQLFYILFIVEDSGSRLQRQFSGTDSIILHY